MTKIAYEAPKVTLIGSFEAVTQGTNVGAFTDAVIPSGTPVGKIPGFVASHLS